MVNCGWFDTASSFHNLWLQCPAGERESSFILHTTSCSSAAEFYSLAAASTDEQPCWNFNSLSFIHPFIPLALSSIPLGPGRRRRHKEQRPAAELNDDERPGIGITSVNLCPPGIRLGFSVCIRANMRQIGTSRMILQ